MPQIGLLSSFFGSYATTTPICRASSAPIVAGNAFPSRLTQSIPSSFAKRSGLLKPFAFVPRKFEQKRW